MTERTPKPRPSWSILGKIEEPQPRPCRFTGLLGKIPTSEQEEQEEQEQPTNAAVRPEPDSFFWAMQSLPVTEAAKHLLVCGTTGSGKTIAIQLYLQSIVERFKADTADPDAPEQLILFDAKSDVMPLLAGLGLCPEEDVWLINPYDARSAIWNLAEAAQTPSMARALATLLVPEEKHSTAPYFPDSARELITAVIQGLNRVAGKTWSFRDLLCALDSREHIERVSAQDPRGGRAAERILSDERHSSGVLSTLGTKLGPFEQVAALWHSSTSQRRFSVQEFLSRRGVLVLGNDPVLRSSFWPINAILLKALSNEILRRANTPPPNRPRHWFILDEFRAMEKVDCIHDLLNRGRSKGVSILLGIQSVEGLREVYGHNGAEDVLSQCANKMFLRAGGPDTAEWTERFFNKVRGFEMSTSHTHGMQGSSDSEQYSLQDRSLFLPSMFLDLPLPGPGRPYKAIYDVPCTGQTLIVERRFEEVIGWCRPPSSEGVVPAVIPRDNSDEQFLLPWTKTEEHRFCGTYPSIDEPNKTKLPPRHDP